jgi:hypothetical protein
MNERENNEKEFAGRVQRERTLELWRKALKGKTWEHRGSKLSFLVAGTFDQEGLRPKIYILATDPNDFQEPYATLTYHDPAVKLAEDEILVRYDGTSIPAAEALIASGIFEEQDRDDTTIGLAGVWKLKGGLNG